MSIGAGPFSSTRSLSYDAVGRMTQEVIHNNGITRSNTFGYDVFNRLRLAHYGAPNQGAGAGGPGDVLTFDYDTLGNRLTQTRQGLTTRSFYNDTAHTRLTRQMTYQAPPGGEPGAYNPPAHTIVSDVSATYDVSGNLKTLGNGTYSWNALGQLTATSGTDAGGATTFGYDVLGRRTTRNIATTAPWGSSVPQWDGWTGANPFDRGGAFAGGVKDGRGSTIGTSVWTGTNSQTATRFDFLPYGEAMTDPAGADLSQGEWAGMTMDNARLYYARNRYYNPQIGRFISEDPIGLMGGINPYMYCDGDPVNRVDPLGLAYVELSRQGFGDGVATGFHALGSAFSFGLYDGGAYKCQPGFRGSYLFGMAGREALLWALTRGAQNRLAAAPKSHPHIDYMAGAGGNPQTILATGLIKVPQYSWGRGGSGFAKSMLHEGYHANITLALPKVLRPLREFVTNQAAPLRLLEEVGAREAAGATSMGAVKSLNPYARWKYTHPLNPKNFQNLKYFRPGLVDVARGLFEYDETVGGIEDIYNTIKP